MATEQSNQLGRCDFKQYEHCGPHERIPAVGQRLPPFGCKNWRIEIKEPVSATPETLTADTIMEYQQDLVACRAVLVSAQSVLSYIYHREGTRLSAGTFEQADEVLRDISRLLKSIQWDDVNDDA